MVLVLLWKLYSMSYFYCYLEKILICCFKSSRICFIWNAILFVGSYFYGFFSSLFETKVHDCFDLIPILLVCRVKWLSWLYLREFFISLQELHTIFLHPKNWGYCYKWLNVILCHRSNNRSILSHHCCAGWILEFLSAYKRCLCSMNQACFIVSARNLSIGLGFLS